MASNGWEQASGTEQQSFPAIERTGSMGDDESGFFNTRRAAHYLGLAHRTLDGYRVSGKRVVSVSLFALGMAEFLSRYPLVGRTTVRRMA